MFHNELVKRRCEIMNLNHRKDLIGQTCIVEKYIAKKDRYKVTTEHAHETFLVGRDNLKGIARPRTLGTTSRSRMGSTSAALSRRMRSARSL